jgi:hypothetical protein
MSVKIGTRKKSTSEYQKREYFSLKDGNNIYRILPPLGELADDGVWSVYHKVHFGYKNQEGKMRTFLSSEVRNKEKMIVTADPALERIQKLESARSKAKEMGNAAMVKKLDEQLFAYSLDKKHYMNAISLDGKIGILKIPHKSKLALDAEMKRLESEGIDPLSAEDGRFFNFNRSGRGLDTIHQVRVHEETVTENGRRIKTEKVHILTDDILSRLEKEASLNLRNLYRVATEEQVRQIVEADMKNDLTQIDDVLGIKAQRQEAASTSPEVTEEEPEESESVAAKEPEQEAPRARASLAETTGVKVGGSRKAVAEPAKDYSQMSADEFLAAMELK